MATDLLKPARIAVSTDGTSVVLSIGNADLRMDYETCIQLSTWLRIRGKEAKRLAGDERRHWSVVGKLDDITHGMNPFSKREF